MLKLGNLETFEASAEDLTLVGFAALGSMKKLHELQLTSFWAPGDQLKFLRALDTYTPTELETVFAVHVLQLLGRHEQEMETVRQRVRRYGTVHVGTADETAKRLPVRRANRLVLEVMRGHPSGEGLQRAIARRALKSAAASSKPNFADQVHEAVERYTTMKFSKPRTAVSYTHLTLPTKRIV